MSRKGAGYRRSLSYSETEGCKREALGVVNEVTPVFTAKRHKFQNDENSPYKTFTEVAFRSTPLSSLAENQVEADLGSSDTDSTKVVGTSSTLTPEVRRLCFGRSQSESALTPTDVKKAVERIESNPNLIGDGSKSYVLPFKLNGKHPDLKEITGETLVDLISGKWGSTVTSFKVIDCRYQYEYDGGHIKGAINLFTKKQVFEELIQPKTTGKGAMYAEERNILIFHCEFSSQRGPDMCRYLRDMDRESNAYPHLHYPELYVLFGGYKAFFEQFPNLCKPQTYLPMDHPSHVEDCRRFKSRTKLEVPVNVNDRFKKSKSHTKLHRASSFAKKCNF